MGIQAGVSPQQAHTLGEHIAALAGQFDVEAVIVSPLSRALQTGVGAFGSPACKGGDAVPLLMVAQESELVRASSIASLRGLIAL
jgi:hypothetical protein